MVDAQPRVGALQAATTAELVAEKVSDATASPESVNRYLEQFQCVALALGVFLRWLEIGKESPVPIITMNINCIIHIFTPLRVVILE